MKVLKRIANGTSAAILSLSSLMTMGFTGVAHATAKTCTWTGTVSNIMNVAGNWSGCNNGVPLAGDFIKFSDQVPSGTDNELTNNLGVTLGGVIAGQVTNHSGSTYYFGSYTIDTITLADGGTLTEDAASDCDVTHGEYVNVDSVTSSGDVTDSAGMTSNAALHIGGDYTTTSGFVNADTGSSVAGNVTIAAAPSTSCGGSGGGFSSGSSIIGFTVNSMTVENGAYVALGDIDFPLTLGGGSGTGAPNVAFYGNLNTDESDYVPTTYTVSAPITLLDDAQFYVGAQATVNVTGAISGAGHALTRDTYSDSTGTLNIQPSSNDSNTQTGKLVNPVVTTTLSDAQPNKDETVLDNETTTLDGTRSYVSVMGNGVLKGTGTADTVFVSQNGTIAPGHSPGKMTIKSQLSLNDGATYQAELKDTADGDFDQLVVGDPADTTGNDVILGDTAAGANLDVRLYDGYNIKAGDQFEIINNLSNTPVLQTFAGLPEGATFKVGNGVFKISYVGGDGNDVVLTVLTAPSVPNTGFALVSTHPGATLIATTIAGAFIVIVAKTNKRTVAPARAKANRRR